ncbi:hypothetical protein STRDD10_00686 [Streptococcus sp. DD10]|uniref:DUF6287 domain-containing protein n=1 Tax=Streptococcus sp. DD10 TaxID=1777878 RepID=UPI0007929A34|nr:DUF6287 domain-containing protein [Streptococcus sp. DD10]KXT74740.1 hypothetical protein STRDD10_00686 [Streptococcus sp. DD10]
MKSRKTRFTALAVVALASVFFLGVCGGQKQATASSSSSKTSQVTKSSKMTKSSSKVKTEKKTQASSSEEKKAEVSENAGETKQASPAKVAEATKEQQSPAKDEQKEEVLVMDATAMENGDFSSVAGTYQNDLGDTITVSASGSVTYTRASDGSTDTSSQLLSGTIQETGYVAVFAHNDGQSSDPIFFDSNGQVRFGSDAEYGKQHVFSKVG